MHRIIHIINHGIKIISDTLHDERNNLRYGFISKIYQIIMLLINNIYLFRKSNDFFFASDHKNLNSPLLRLNLHKKLRNRKTALQKV